MAESTRNARRYIVKRIISPKLGSLKVSELTDLDIRRAIEPLIDKAPSTALMVRDILSSLYRWLNEAKGLRIGNPAQYIKPSAIHVFHSRDRNLSASEIRDFYAALSFTPIASSNKAFLKLLLLTAVRKGELIGARWSEIDFEEEKWTIPPERMKGSLAHIVYLSHQAIDLLMGLQLVGGGSSEYVFRGGMTRRSPLSLSLQTSGSMTPGGPVRRRGSRLNHFLLTTSAEPFPPLRMSMDSGRDH